MAVVENCDKFAMELMENNLQNIKDLRPVLLFDEQFLSDKADIARCVVEGLEEKVDNIAVVCPDKYRDLFSSRVAVITHPAYKFVLLWRQSRKMLFDKLREFKPDIIHCLSPGKSHLACTIARDLNIPYIVNIDSENDKPCVLQTHCGRVIAVCGSVYRAIANRKRCKYIDKLEHINYATVTEDGCACFDSSNTLISMILVSDFHRLNKLEPLLNAVRHLAIDGYDFILFLIGAGKAELKVRRLLKSLGLSNIVNVVPMMNPLREIFKEGDIFLKPETRNAFDPCLLKAMSVGMAVAGCKDDVDDLMIKDQTVCQFDPLDEFSIYSALQKIFDNRQFTRTLASNSQALLRKDYNVTTIVESMLDIYRDTASWYENKSQPVNQ